MMLDLKITKKGILIIVSIIIDIIVKDSKFAFKVCMQVIKSKDSNYCTLAYWISLTFNLSKGF